MDFLRLLHEVLRRDCMKISADDLREFKDWMSSSVLDQLDLHLAGVDFDLVLGVVELHAEGLHRL